MAGDNSEEPPAVVLIPLSLNEFIVEDAAPLMQRMFSRDTFECPSCCGRMRVIAHWATDSRTGELVSLLLTGRDRREPVRPKAS